MFYVYQSNRKLIHKQYILNEITFSWNYFVFYYRKKLTFQNPIERENLNKIFIQIMHRIRLTEPS